MIPFKDFDLRLSRRATLGLGFGAAALAASPWRAMAAGMADVLPTPEEMRVQMRRAILPLGKKAEIRPLGLSKMGRPLELVSIGEGERSALIVGAPHANEPIGCNTIALLVDRLVNDEAFRKNSGYRWHFIQAIDVDGVSMNQGWFKGRRTPSDYFHNFFRPAFNQQPEYTFPVDMPGYRFDASTVENICWQKALELTKPQLQCSLHNAESGGAFYILSRPVPALIEALPLQSQQSGVWLNPQGEGNSDMTVYAPGVMGFPAMMMRAASVGRSGGDARRVWNAGRSSAQYASDKYGTLSMTCEVPIWNDPRLFNHSPSGFTTADIDTRRDAERRETADLTSQGLPILRPLARTLEERALLASLEEAQARSGATPSAASASKPEPKPLTMEEYGFIDSNLRTFGMRPVATLWRLARSVRSADLAERARAILTRRLEQQRRDAPLEAFPLAQLSKVQLLAITTAADAIKAA